MADFDKQMAEIDGSAGLTAVLITRVIDKL